MQQFKRVLSLSITSSVEVRMYPFPQPTLWTWDCIPVYSKQCGRESVSFSTVNSMDIRCIPVYSQQFGQKGVSLSEVSSDMWWCFPFYYQWCGHEGCIPLHLQRGDVQGESFVLPAIRMEGCTVCNLHY
jgi:hypothetical protein